MRKSILLTTILGACLSLLTFGANATPTPINVNLSVCAGLTSCTTGGVTFTGWENDGSGWQTSALTFKADGPNETGLGVSCIVSGPKCGQNEINTNPWQFITVDLSGTHASSLSLGVGSVDSGGDPGNETAYLLSAICANPLCTTGLLGSYTFDGTHRTNLFSFGPGDFTDFIGVTPHVFSTDAPDGNVLLGSLSYTVAVPEPAVLGIFGLGVLMIGLLVGLHRRLI